MSWLGRTAQRSGRRRTRRNGTGERAPANADQVIDLTETAAREVSPEDLARAAELAQRLRARRARMEAEAELQRLRDRHWSGERLLDEARIEIEWWEHPDADPYAVLGLIPGASLDAAAAARRRIAQQCHPDRVDEDSPEGREAMRRMVAANGAYERIRRALRPV